MLIPGQWGIVLMCIAACHSFASLMVCRFILGVLESPVNPAFMVVTSQWYKRDEQPERSGFWNMGLSIAQIIGGVLGYGFGQIQYRDWNPWRWFFIIYGAITVLWGFVLYMWFPDSPMTARWLSEEDRVLAVERVRENRTGIVNTEWKWEQ
jgi:ACS family allantoate permease-like MFS transporter